MTFLAEHKKIVYADVILPLALPHLFTYIIPVDYISIVQPGHRVIVQFGKNKYYTAIVASLHHQAPAVAAKPIETVADEYPIVTAQQLRFWQWMADYYMCTIGEVMNAALPAGLKLSSETRIYLNESYEGDFEHLSDEEFVIIQLLKNNQSITIPELQQALEKKNVYPALKKLFTSGILVSSEELIERYKPKTETYIRLTKEYLSSEAQEQVFEQLGKAPKQVALLLAFFQLKNKQKFLKKKELLSYANTDAALLKKLIERGIFEEYKIEVSRLGNFYEAESEIPPLSEMQRAAFNEINEWHNDKQTVLLYGVTASGKTQVYLELIAQYVANGKQCLLLLPEIALTAHIINRIQHYFGSIIGVYHSKFNHQERIEIWNKILNNEYKVVVAARSGLFLPFTDLGLVIIDEEHDSSLKQFDPAPRYHARDAAIVLAAQFGAKVLLGTATPAIETYYNVERGKYGMVKMMQRYGDVALPEVSIIDLKKPIKEKTMQYSFSPEMVNAMNDSLLQKKQVILFINRRGFSQYEICKTCGYVFTCINCDISLTYHKFNNKLQCHYCGYQEKAPVKCKQCGAIDLEIMGMGTEKIEEEIKIVFPTAKVGRMDYDTTRTKFGHNDIISDFENREIDILVGTQMVTKGLDFEHVNLVGILNADMLLHYPGYKAYERAFDLLTQVSGRAGRRGEVGKVLLQTMKPKHPVLTFVKENNYSAFYQSEMQMRKQFHYPPLLRMTELTLKGKDALLTEKAALYLALALKKNKAMTVLGPTIPPVGKVKLYYLRTILVKTNDYTKDISSWKNELLQSIEKLRLEKDFRSIQVVADVDVA